MKIKIKYIKICDAQTSTEKGVNSNKCALLKKGNSQ